jgi:hypothetical protein
MAQSKAFLSALGVQKALFIGGRINEEPNSPKFDNWFGIVRDAGDAGFRAGQC